jgi:hypothetical protein
LPFKRNNPEREKRQQILDEAVSGWRDAEAHAPAPRLSEGARANVRALARQATDRSGRAVDRPLARLFLPIGRLAAAVTLPALILAVSFGWMLRDSQQPVVTDIAAVAIEGHKLNGQAVFDIANGGRVHRVYKSTSANDMSGEDLFATVDGAFIDRLAGDDGVIFYRID